MATELDADLHLSLAAALEAGWTILSAFGSDHHVVHKEPGQPLTEADLAADRLLRTRLSAARAEYGWLSEETPDTDERMGRDRVWIVDPIDGTNSFIKGRREFSVSIGLVERGGALLGVVHNPATGEVFWATRGGGSFVALHRHDRGPAGGRASGGVEATRPDASVESEAEEDWNAAASALGASGQAMRVRTAAPTQRPCLLASRSELRAGELDAFRKHVRFLPTGSTAYKLARVAAGAADGYVSRGPKGEWDVCAGLLLVREAGGQATDTLGAVPGYNRSRPFVRGVVAARPGLHTELVERVRRLDAVPRMMAAETRFGPRPDEEG